MHHQKGSLNVEREGIVKNKNYEKDVNRTFRYPRLFFTFLGIWPMITRYTSKKSKFLSIIAIFVCLLMIAFTFVPSALHTIFREKNPVVRVMLLGPVGASFGAILKYALIIVRADRIKSCVDEMKRDWMSIENEDEHAIMTGNLRIVREVTLLSTVFLYTGGMSYHMMIPILKGTKLNEFNQTIRPLSCPGYDIFIETHTSPTYEIIFFLICASTFVRYLITIGVCSIAATFVIHACGQVQIVMLRLAKLCDGFDENSNRSELEKKISIVVQRHVNGLRLSAKIEESLRDVWLIEVMSSTLSICLLEYACMMVQTISRAVGSFDISSKLTSVYKSLNLQEWEHSQPLAFATRMLLLVSYVFNVFIFCHIGERLQEQYQRVGKAAYMVEWYKLPDRVGLAIVMIMAMASYPRKLTAGRMMELSLRNFGTVMRTSLGYLNMLRATTV